MRESWRKREREREKVLRGKYPSVIKLDLTSDIINISLFLDLFVLTDRNQD